MSSHAGGAQLGRAPLAIDAPACASYLPVSLKASSAASMAKRICRSAESSRARSARSAESVSPTRHRRAGYCALAESLTRHLASASAAPSARRVPGASILLAQFVASEGSASPGFTSSYCDALKSQLNQVDPFLRTDIQRLSAAFNGEFFRGASPFGIYRFAAMQPDKRRVIREIFGASSVLHPELRCIAMEQGDLSELQGMAPKAYRIFDREAQARSWSALHRQIRLAVGAINQLSQLQ